MYLEWYVIFVNGKLKGYANKRSWHILKYCLNISLESVSLTFRKAGLWTQALTFNGHKVQLELYVKFSSQWDRVYCLFNLFYSNVC